MLNVIHNCIADVHSAVFEEDPASGKVCCKECYQADPVTTNWMMRNSTKNHLKSGDHNTAIEINQERRATQAVQAAEYQSMYTSGFSDTPFNSTFTQTSPPSRSAMFDKHEYDNMPDLYDGADSDDEDDETTQAFHCHLLSTLPSADVQPITNDVEGEQERLRRQVEILFMDAERADIMGTDDDDATLTNIENQFEGLGV